MNRFNNIRSPSAFQKVIDKVFSKSTFTSSTTATNAVSPIDQNENNIKLSNITIDNLITNIKKMINHDNKSKKFEASLYTDLGNWANSSSVPNYESSMVLRTYANLILQNNNNFKMSMIDKLEKLKVSLLDVSNRETKQRNLIKDKIKLESQLRESRNKFGVKASKTILLEEKLEEVNVALNVVESQLVKSINNDLKDSLIDYALQLNFQAGKLQAASDDFITYLTSLENNKNGNGNDNDNDIARVSPNKYQRKEDRENRENRDHRNGGIDLRNYDLPTPQSLCPECNRKNTNIPCSIHKDTLKQNHSHSQFDHLRNSDAIGELSYQSSEHWN
ncbi:unnamed protein product [Candida verbasci]|uniref:Uncharacterized protein n=1 Tax=Candida verbasci TaxID=1227364 RepID=A0A9W4TT90_9ASCO|nr:unnamed protein product [Candida verbasci]